MKDSVKYDLLIVDYPTLIFEPNVSKEVTEHGRSLLRQLTRSLKMNQLFEEDES